MSDDKEHAAPSSVALPADAAPTAPGDSASPGPHPIESEPAAPVGESKPQAAPGGVPAPTADDPKGGEGLGRDLKEGSPVGSAEDKPVAESAEHPALAETADEASEKGEAWAGETGAPEVKLSEEPKAEESKAGESKPEEPEPEESRVSEDAAEPAGDQPEPADEALPGEKRSAAVANGAGAEDGPAEKKVKIVSGEAPTANGGAGRRGGKGKKGSKEAPPAGKTARRTRSQGLTEL